MAATAFSRRNRVAPGALGRLTPQPGRAVAPHRPGARRLRRSRSRCSGASWSSAPPAGATPPTSTPASCSSSSLVRGDRRARSCWSWRWSTTAATASSRPSLYGGGAAGPAHGRDRARDRAQRHPGLVPARAVPAPAVGAGEDRRDRRRWPSVIAHFDSELDARRLLAGSSAWSACPDGADHAAARPRHHPRVRGGRAWGCCSSAGCRSRHIAALTLVGIVGVVDGAQLRHARGVPAVPAHRRSSRPRTRRAPSAARRTTWSRPRPPSAPAGSLGTGLFDGTQTRLDIVPEQHTDFIFTAVGEELGFVGSAALLTLLSHHRLADLAHRPAGPRPLRHADLRRRAVDVRVPGLRERRHDHGDHADHRHPAAVRELRRLQHDDGLHRPSAWCSTSTCAASPERSAGGHSPPAEVAVDTGLRRSGLLDEQHPDLAGERDAPRRRGVGQRRCSGWAPTSSPASRGGSPAAALMEHELRWARPGCRTICPLPIPRPVRGRRAGRRVPLALVDRAPGCPGADAESTPPDDLDAAAGALGAFMAALHRPAPPDAPRNPYRGRPAVRAGRRCSRPVSRTTAVARHRPRSVGVWADLVDTPVRRRPAPCGCTATRTRGTSSSIAAPSPAWSTSVT